MHHVADERPETTGLVITQPRRYDLRVMLHTLGREGRFRREQVRRARLAPGETVLDVGTGTGGFALEAARAVGPTGSVTGVDPSPEMIGRARAKAGRRSAARFQTAAIERLPFPDATFDVVTLSLVLHQLPSDAFHAGMVEVRRVLKPGGRLFAVDMGGPQDPNRRTSHAPHGRSADGAPGHAGFDLDRVSMFFEHLGFEIVDSGPIEFRFVYLEHLRYVLARRGAQG
jgi:ubiquinone/menaquinone biosynthesis C-methylase UbiE